MIDNADCRADEAAMNDRKSIDREQILSNR